MPDSSAEANFDDPSEKVLTLEEEEEAERALAELEGRKTGVDLSLAEDESQRFSNQLDTVSSKYRP